MKLLKIIGKRNENKSVFLKEYIKNNSKECIFLITFLIIGVIIGVLFINNASKEKINIISDNIHNIEDVVLSQKQIDNGELLIKSLKQNIFIILIIWILGCMIIGVPLLFALMIYKGFCFGYAIARYNCYIKF